MPKHSLSCDGAGGTPELYSQRSPPLLFSSAPIAGGVRRAKYSPETTDPRLADLLARKPVRVATDAMANKTARIAAGLRAMRPAIVGVLPGENARTPRSAIPDRSWTPVPPVRMDNWRSKSGFCDCDHIFPAEFGANVWVKRGAMKELIFVAVGSLVVAEAITEIMAVSNEAASCSASACRVQ